MQKKEKPFWIVCNQPFMQSVKHLSDQKNISSD